ncbi:MAG: nickel pincer cofactor biosynthesis protein LarB [Methanosarcina flavescens]|jgi:NCAIR mutase (PurE)-related protein|uniref:Nickel pincer cofactor biosynthesis protein LarB n=1 Tax=Methanosarcina flavescens TaxID=1715806 RepID=A0A660HR04_9EURY|nr:nickel pincer cofactor biosynthesis protein LarB [Methanosarcina flavescens]AYK14652.1 nickel pincer cofactor biosynthesis protein LarB [Methanosarcina flavescens]
MDLTDILRAVKEGKMDLETAKQQARGLGFVSYTDIAKLDSHRKSRTGVIEAILADCKSPDDVVEIARVMVAESKRALITRVSPQHVEVLKQAFGEDKLEWNSRARTVVIHDGTPAPRTGGIVGIVSAGTADIPAAEEARVVASEMGCETVTVYDVGVAGIHRLIPALHKLKATKPGAIVVAAGREGTLPTIVSGLVDAPVIGLPVSTGYGAGGGGKAALLAMLQSCSTLAVVNIDAGFVAGAYAARIANMIAAAYTRGREDRVEQEGK